MCQVVEVGPQTYTDTVSGVRGSNRRLVPVNVS